VRVSIPGFKEQHSLSGACQVDGQHEADRASADYDYFGIKWELRCGAKFLEHGVVHLGYLQPGVHKV
jgi:hypothetical protein